MKEPLIRMLYRDYKGNIFTVLGIAEDAESKESCVIYSSVDNGKTFVRKLSSFLEVSKKTGKKRFELVTPKK